MVFSSIIFMFTFLPIILVTYYLSPRKLRNFILLLGSLVFYAWGEPIYIILMILTIIINYVLALLIKNQKGRRKKIIFVLTLALNVGMLGFFKYYDFIVRNINSIFSLNIQYNNLSLPIGISFYTFQTISYIVDVYLNKVEVQKNIISFATYISMFPHLVAGPIVKYTDINGKLEKRKESIDEFGYGVERFIAGLGKKVLLANNIGYLWSVISVLDINNISVATSWIGIAAYTFQIYFDFSGYSDMAIGLGHMFGFTFKENFKYPYISKSVTEFWRRWHISLSTWFKEYVYIPLGGNREGVKKQCRNLMIVWILTGLWHGASYNFIIWGMYYGVILIIEKFIIGIYIKNLPTIFRRIYTLVIVMVGWVFFGMNTLYEALNYLKVMFFISGNAIIDDTALYYLSTNIILFIILIMASTPIPGYIVKKVKSYNSIICYTMIGAVNVLILIIATAYLLSSTYNPFIYFRF